MIINKFTLTNLEAFSLKQSSFFLSSEGYFNFWTLILVWFLLVDEYDVSPLRCKFRDNWGIEESDC